MGLNRTLTVRPGNFSGNSKVYSAGPEGLAAQIRSLQAQQASTIAIAGAVADFANDSSATIEPVTLVTFDATGGTNEDQVTLVGGDLGVPTGHPVIFEGGDVALPLVAGTTYYVIRLQGSGQAGTKSPNLFQVADSQLNAELGVPIEFDDDGSGVTGISFQIMLPPPPVSFDATDVTTGVLATQVLVTTDTIMETLGSIMVKMNLVRAALGMEQPDDGTLTSADTIAAVDVAATANTNNNDAATFASVVANAADMNNAIVTVALSINDLAAALDLTEYTDFLSPHLGVENAAGAIDSPTAGAAATGSAAATVQLTVFNAALVVWGSCAAHLAGRVSVVSDAAQTASSSYTEFIVPTATEVNQVLPGTRTRQR